MEANRIHHPRPRQELSRAVVGHCASAAAPSYRGARQLGPRHTRSGVIDQRSRFISGSWECACCDRMRCLINGSILYPVVVGGVERPLTAHPPISTLPHI